MRASNALSRHFIRSIINPNKHVPLQALKKISWVPKSFLCLANSRNIQRATKGVESVLKEYPSLQIVLGCVDSVHQDVISEVWLDQEMKMLENEVLITRETRDDEIKTQLSLKIHESEIKINLLETFGFNDNTYTLFYKPSNKEQTPPLAKLDIELPIIPNNIKKFTSLTPISDWLEINENLTNIIKKISDKPASKVLIDSLKASSLVSSEQATRVFAEVEGPEDPSNVYEIIAGGGEYGSKSEMLVFESFQAKGDSLKCRFLVSDEKKKSKVEGLKGLVVEQIHDENRIVSEGDDVILDGIVRIGSMTGFELDGVNYKAVNDLLNVDF